VINNRVEPLLMAHPKMALGAWFVNMSNAPIYIMFKIGMEDKIYGI
jgi:hypothetical protein